MCLRTILIIILLSSSLLFVCIVVCGCSQLTTMLLNPQYRKAVSSFVRCAHSPMAPTWSRIKERQKTRSTLLIYIFGSVWECATSSAHAACRTLAAACAPKSSEKTAAENVQTHKWKNERIHTKYTHSFRLFYVDLNRIRALARARTHSLAQALAILFDFALRLVCIFLSYRILGRKRARECGNSNIVQIQYQNSLHTHRANIRRTEK